MTAPTKKRRRRSAAEARRHLIACAEKLLVRGGPLAVQMRSVAREAGVTDAGVAHHFGNRRGLLKALLDAGARKVRDGVAQIAGDWASSGPDLTALIDMLEELYANGYAELALELHRSGWKDRGPPLMEPVILRLRTLNQNPRTTDADIRAAVAALHLDLAMDPVFGNAFRQSAGMTGSASRIAQRRWWVRTMTQMLTPEKP